MRPFLLVCLTRLVRPSRLQLSSKTAAEAVVDIEKLMRASSEWEVATITSVSDEGFETEAHGSFTFSDEGVLWRSVQGTRLVRTRGTAVVQAANAKAATPGSSKSTRAQATPPASVASSSGAKPNGKALATAAKGSTAVPVARAVDDGLLERAQLAVAKRESLVSQQRATRMREIRNQLDEGVVDVDDDETLDRNKETARKRAKEEVPDDARVVKLRGQVEQLQAAETEEAAILKQLAAVREKVTKAREGVSALVEEMEGGEELPPPAKKAKK